MDFRRHDLLSLIGIGFVIFLMQISLTGQVRDFTTIGTGKKCLGESYSMESDASYESTCFGTCLGESNCSAYSYSKTAELCLYFNESECTGLVYDLDYIAVYKTPGFEERKNVACNGTGPHMTVTNVSTVPFLNLHCIDVCLADRQCHVITYNFSNPSCDLFSYQECHPASSTIPEAESLWFYERAYCFRGFPEADNGVLVPNPHPVLGNTVYYFEIDPIYECSDGYQMTKNSTVECVGSSRLTGDPPVCTYTKYFDCGVSCFQVLEGSTYELDCGPDFEIFMIRANLGWDPLLTCEDVIEDNTECLNGQTDSIRSSCNGLQTCTLTAGSSVGCPSNTTSYLQGEYKCIQSGTNSSCKAPLGCYNVNITNGDYNVTLAREGGTLQFNCDPGYEFIEGDNDLDNSVVQKCLSNGTLEQGVPNCTVIHCPDLIAPDHSRLSTNETQYATNVTYICDDGYKPNTSTSKVCEAHKEWTPGGSVACDIIHCPGLPVPEHGYISTTNTQFQTEVIYSCDAGYELDIANMTKVCQSSTEWQPAYNVSCLIINCPTLSEPEHGRLSTANTTYLTSVSYSCEEGYALTPTDADKICQASKEWDPQGDVACNLINCGNYSLNFGEVSAPQGTTYGETATISCQEGYKIDGESSKVITCTLSGSWSFSEDCLIVDCEDPPAAPANGEIQFVATVYGSMVNYSCRSGYLLQGNASGSCMSDGSWNVQRPYCQLLNRHTQLIDLETSLDCEAYTAAGLQDIYTTLTEAIKNAILARIQILPEDIIHLVFINVIGIRCNSPLVVLVEVDIGNLLSNADTMSQLNTVIEEVVEEGFTVEDASGSTVNIEIQAVTAAENEVYQCSGGYYYDLENSVCLPCPKHFYQPSEFRELCWPCPRGTVTESDGTYGDEATVCQSADNTQGYTTLIGLGIGIPVFFLSMAFLVLGVYMMKKPSPTNKLSESISSERPTQGSHSYYTDPYRWRSRRYVSYR